MTTKMKKEIVSAQMQITNDVIGAWKAQILFTLNGLEIFEALEQRPKSLQELSQSLRLPEDSLNRVLNVAVAVGYLLKSGEKYSNAPFIHAVMNKDADGYLGNWLQMYERWYKTFSRLPEAVREGSAVEDVNAVTDENYHLTFIRGMKDYAGFRGRDILNHIDLSKAGRLLDVGCGPGIYVAMFCEKYSQLRCTCYDVPEALVLAKEYLEDKGLQARVNFQPGNYKKDSSFGESQYDVVFISHVLHQEDESTCADIVKKAFRALKPGGTIIIQAMFLNDTGIGPLYASFHDLLCLLIFPGGRNHTFQETTILLSRAGFTNIRNKRMSFFNVNSLMYGEKGEGL
jgi:2-polyprenyl-3-methyl-5-hydroxy-6-metoxy-1,4-benzoquinol methylase